ncbi:E3 ubiquitin-protein ligase [Canna indica]|uniref:E3 ubiquitin-protein ligase n=1 Tax=Canna indica TaxID=4628 RepID=A0AAQ3L113_9LILI|nr:E3 ubiquitin-protein ligase [Canna indica]
MELLRSEKPPSSLELGDAHRNRRSYLDRPPSDYGSKAVQDALEHLASINLLELCNEAKIERCRATRDLSSCGRCVQHVLSSCGHASLCEECSKRCDACPICRTLVPNNGCQLHLRLYYECIEVGLISKQHDDRSQEREVSREHMSDEIQRLYSLFDVALENNLVSLICHYVMDVCMNENAVSSDPVFAFLLDEVVVKDWCKWKFRNIVFNLRGIYNRGTEEMKSSLCLMQKLALHLGGLSNVLEVMASSFKETFAAQLNDLHHLLENVLKTKQHLEVMIWCTSHQFLQDVQSRFSNSDSSRSWNMEVCERKSAAVRRSWAECSSTLVDSARFFDSTLFIEDALTNLGIEESCALRGEEVDISCLQDESSPLLFLSKIDTSGTGCYYPFQSLRAAADVLFLRGTSDMVVAKQAILLYYLFDRHWTKPDAEWKYIVDDFAVVFGIPKQSLQESLVFYLLDDHTLQALQEAICLLPEIACPDTHPKIAQVLIERECPDVALSVLRCSGRDGCCTGTNSEKDCSQDILLGEAVIAVRVRIECGLLTEAFMLQRMHFSKAKEKSLKHGLNKGFSNSSSNDFPAYLTEVLVTEICHHCIRRNLVDRMIELPWNSVEEKYLHKCLLDYASQNPSSTCGSLLVVFYLQRHRYKEAYQVNCHLENMEQNSLESVNEDVASRIHPLSQWRAGLIDKCLSLLPEVQRQKVLTGNVSDNGHSSPDDVQMSSLSDSSNGQQNPAALYNSSINTSILLQTNSRKFNAPAASPMHNDSSQFGGKAPSVLQRKLLSSFESPSANTKAITTNRVSSSYPLNGENPFSNGANLRETMLQTDFRRAIEHVDSRRSMKFRRTPKAKLAKAINSSAVKLLPNEYQFHGERSFDVGPVEFTGQAENMQAVSPRVMLEDNSPNGFLSRSNHNQIPSSGNYNLQDGETVISKEPCAYPWSFGNRDAPGDKNFTVGARWRSDESSEEEDFNSVSKYIVTGASLTSKRQAGFSRR